MQVCGFVCCTDDDPFSSPAVQVCNHPQLFDRADVKAPLAFGGFARTASIMREGDFLTCPDSARNPIEVTVPRLFEEDGGLLTVPSESSRAGSDTYNLQTLMSIWSVDHISKSLKHAGAYAHLTALQGLSN
jgi:DNA helicase INO80